MRDLSKLTSINRPARVLLIRAPQKFYNARFPQGPRLSVPLGILAIASFLKQHGTEARVYDAFVEGEQFRQFIEGETRLPGKIGADKDDLAHFGASWEELHDAIAAWQPDIIGISTIFDETIEDGIQASQIARQAAPDAVIIMGGPSVSSNGEFFLDNGPEIDIVCRGDGEETTMEIVEWVEGRRALAEIANVITRDGDAKRKGPERTQPVNLDVLGHIDYDLVDMERYFALEARGIMSRQRFMYPGSERAISIITSRGCPYYCSFCSVHIHAGRKYRTFSAAHVLDHVETLVRKYGIKHIHFEDDNLTLDRQRFMDLANGFLARGLKFTWDTPNGVHANTLSEDMLIKMKEIGCVYLVVAVESGDQWVIDEVIRKKPMKLENVLNAFEVGHRIGLDMQAFYVIGFPREKLSQVMTTLKFAMDGLKKWDVVPHVQVAMANTGTELHREALSLGMLATQPLNERKNAVGIRMDAFARPVISTDEWSAEGLKALNDSYHRKFIILLFLKLLGFSLRHPVTAVKNLKHYLAIRRDMGASATEAGMILFFTRLLYPNALCREGDLR